jgi:AmmeMemoRadiSam system protein A
MPSLSEAERRVLLELAHLSVVEAVSHGQLPEKIPTDGMLAERRGVFVTLHVRGRLRGCIGVIEAEEPLGEAVARCAASAALQDARFSPLRPEELGNLEIEISLLSPLAPIAADEVEIGLHGLLIAQGAKRGLLLPQVAVEHHLTREQFLEETCRKAGLAREIWRHPDTKLSGFTCEVFSSGGSASCQE